MFAYEIHWEGSWGGCDESISKLRPGDRDYRGASLIRNTPLLGPHSRTIPRVVRWSYGGGLFLMSEVPLYAGSGPGFRNVNSS